MAYKERRSKDLVPCKTKGSFVKLVKDIDWTKYRPFRVGVIPYITYNDRLIFGPGLDYYHREVTDYGGGTQITDRTALYGALREMYEETLGAFGYITEEQVSLCPVVGNNDMMIVFIHLLISPWYVAQRFHQAASEEKWVEVSNILWIEAGRFLALIQRDDSLKLYSRVRSLLNGVDFVSYL